MNLSKTNVILLAAGQGTRLRPFTLDNPKPTLPLFSIPMGYYILPYLEKINVDKYVVNTFHLPQKIKDCYLRTNLNIQFSDESDFIKDSAGGMKQAESILNTSNYFIVANSDEIFFTENTDFLSQAINQHVSSNSLATVIVIKHPEAGHKFGAVWTQNDQSKDVVIIGKDKPNTESTPWHYIGLQILSKKIFQYIKPNTAQNIFYDVINSCYAQEKIQIFPIRADWYETGNIVDYTLAKKEIFDKLKTNSVYQKHFENLKKFPKSNLSDLT